MSVSDEPMKDEFFACACHTNQHTVRFTFDPALDPEDPPDLYLSVQLNHELPLYKRIPVAINYVLGRMPRYGQWGNTSIRMDDADRLLRMAQDFKTCVDKWNARWKRSGLIPPRGE